MSVVMNIKGTSSDTLQVGKGGPKLKRNSNAIEARNTADSAYEVVRVAEALADNDAINKGQLTQAIRSAGIVALPSYTNNGNGSITVGTGVYSLYDNPNYSGTPKTYTIPGGTYTLTDNSANYVLASYNGGSPILEIVTSVPPANTTDSDRVPVFSTYRSGTDIHFFNWDHLSSGLAEKINQRLRRTDRFHIDNGLGLSETPTRVIDISAGEVWAGANLIALNAITSSSPEVHFYYHVGGVWTRGNLSQYNNTQYDNGTALVTLTNNKYAVNWVYRSVEQVGAIYVILGNGDYSLLEAQASKEPVKPSEISTQAVLVGRVIVHKSVDTATQIDRVVDVTFGASPIAAHNDLTGIQGGTVDEYYHLTSAQHTNLTATRTSGSVLFQNSSGIAEDNANLFWDDTNNRLGLSNTSPSAQIEINSDPLWTISAAPTPTAVASDTGGTVPAGTYYFRLFVSLKSGSAVSADSLPVTVNTSTGSVAVSWTPVPGAVLYQLYRTTTAGTYTSPSSIGFTSNNSFTWLGSVTSGAPGATIVNQSVLSDKFQLNDTYTTVGSIANTFGINRISGLTANNTFVQTAQAVRNTVYADNPYNHGAMRGIQIQSIFAGSGTTGANIGVLSTANYYGRGSSSGNIQGGQFNAQYNGANTITIAGVTGSVATANVNSGGRVTTLAGMTATASVGSFGDLNATAGTMYGMRADATHSSTGKTVDNTYGVYGNVSATATNGVATRIQGGFFQASVGNGTGGATVTSGTHRALEGWAFQNNTGIADNMEGGLFTASSYGKVNYEITGSRSVGENQGTAGNNPLIVGSRMYALNYQTTDTMYGGIAEVQHNANTHLYSARGFSSAVINNSGGTIDDARGYNVSVINSSGTITNGYGLYVGSVHGTNRWGVYQEDANARNYFSGNTGIGTITPQQRLHISKSATTVAGIDSTENGLVLSNGLTGTSTEKTNRLALYAFGSGSNSIRLAHGGAASSESSPLYPTNLTSLGAIGWSGWDENTSSWQGAASITVIPEVTWNATTRDSVMRFFTTKGTSPGERARITSNGNLLIGSITDDTTNKLQLWGNAALKSTVSASDLKFFEGSSGNNYVRVIGQEVLSADFTLTLPAKTGTLATLDDITGGGSQVSGLLLIGEFTNGVEFTAGTSTQLTLATAETGNGHFVFFDGIKQFQSTYSISGTTVTFTSAIPAGVQKVEITRGLGSTATSAPIVTKTANYTATVADYTIRCDASSAPITITLPTATTNVGKIYNIKKVAGANNVTINTTSSQTIDGNLTVIVPSLYDVITVQSNGTNWDII